MRMGPLASAAAAEYPHITDISAHTRTTNADRRLFEGYPLDSRGGITPGNDIIIVKNIRMLSVREQRL